MPINTEKQKEVFLESIRNILNDCDGVDISAVEDYTKYLKPGQTVAQLINLSKDSTWAVYTERGNNEGHYINIELLQGMTKRCPILAMRSHEEKVGLLLPVVEKLIAFLETINPNDVFAFK